MGQQESVTFPIRGVDRRTPADAAAPGACRAIENLVPQGSGDTPTWEAPAPAGQITDPSGASVNGILSLGVQRRDEVGPLADTDTDPDQSLDRLLALKAGGLYVIDPGQGHKERQLYDFGSADDSRRAQFAQLGDSTVVAVTSEGSGGGTANGTAGSPEILLEVRDDAVTPLRWAPLPLISVSWTGDTSGDFLPEGTGPAAYVFRVAWQLAGGAIGPASGPLISETPTGSSSYKPTITVDAFPSAPPAGWEEREAGLVVIGHAPVTDEDGNVTGRAIEQPGFVIGHLEGRVGDSFTFFSSKEDLVASEAYPPPGLEMHDRVAGAAYAYNQRLLLGDIATDLYAPDLRAILDWTEGTSGDGSDVHWALLEVKVSTESGVLTRYSQPLPFHNEGGSPPAQSVTTRQGAIYYRDERAFQWRLLVSTDYAEGDDLSSADWKALALQGVSKSFDEAAGSFFGYRDVRNQSPFDLTQTVDAAVEVGLLDFDVDGTVEWKQEGTSTDATGFDSTAHASTSPSFPGDAESEGHNIELAVSQALSGDLDTLTVNSALVEDDDEGLASATLLVEVRASDDTVLASITHETPGSYADTLSASDGDFSASDAENVRVQTFANASVSGGSDLSAEAEARIDGMTLSTGTATAGPVEVAQGANDRVNRVPTKITWSEPFQPLNRPAQNLLYAGSDASDPVMALQATGQAVSEGQFGQYPIACLQAGSIRLLEMGGADGPFVQNVAPITTQMGLVGRRAYANVDGAVVAVTDRGVYELSPQLRRPPLSGPLHDERDRFLKSLGTETTCTFYSDDSGRREVWVGAEAETWVFSLTAGGASATWSSLGRRRYSFARLEETPYGVDPGGGLWDETGGSSALTALVVTAPFALGEEGYQERLFALLFRRRRAPSSLAWSLCALDSALTTGTGSAAERQRATVPGPILAHDLLPNVEVASGTLADTAPGTIYLPKALGYQWFVRLEAQMEAGQSIDALGAEVEPRRRGRPADRFPSPSTEHLSPVSLTTSDVALDFTDPDNAAFAVALLT